MHGGMYSHLKGVDVPTWLMAVDNLYEILGYFAVVAVSLAALALGSVRERLVAVIFLLDAVTISAVDLYLDGWWRIWTMFGKAVLLFAFYAGSSWRWPHSWLIVMTSLQFIDLLLVMALLVDASIMISVNGLIRNVIGWLMLLTLSLAIVQTARLRRAERM